MAIKTYNVTQYVKFNGAVKKTSFVFKGDEAGLTAFIALLEGGVKVTEQNDTLTNLSKKDTAVTEMMVARNVRMIATATNGEYLSASIKAFSGSIMFKNTVSATDIKSVLIAQTPYWQEPATHPADVAIDGWSDGLTSK